MRRFQQAEQRGTLQVVTSDQCFKTPESPCSCWLNWLQHCKPTTLTPSNGGWMTASKTLETTTGVSGDAAVLLHQVLQRLVSPVRRHHIRELHSREWTDVAHLRPGQGRTRQGQHCSSRCDELTNKGRCHGCGQSISATQAKAMPIPIQMPAPSRRPWAPRRSTRPWDKAVTSSNRLPWARSRPRK